MVYRYSELSKLHDYVKKNYMNSNDLPKFPSRKLWKNNEKVINERREQLSEYLNKLSQCIEFLYDDYICSFLKIEGYTREYLTDIIAKSQNSSPSRRKLQKKSKKESFKDRHKSEVPLYQEYQDEHSYFFDSDSEESNSKAYLNKKSILDFNKMNRKTQNVDVKSTKFSMYTKKPYRERQEMSLIEIQQQENLTDEEIIIKFFENVSNLPEKKDYFIRDFEEFYFRIKPKFSSKLIKLLLEGEININIIGLLSLMSEIETSFVSACSTLQLLWKLLDFQKNIYAEHFIKELSKIEPGKMKKYNFEKFLLKEGSEGYRQCALNILYTYVEKRKNLKSTIGTVHGNLDRPDNVLKTFEDRKMQLKKLETEQKTVSLIIFSKKIQEELLEHIKVKQALAKKFSTSHSSSQLPPSSSNNTKFNKTFMIKKHQKSTQELSQMKETSSRDDSSIQFEKSKSEIVGVQKIKEEDMRNNHHISYREKITQDDFTGSFFAKNRVSRVFEEIQSIEDFIEIQNKQKQQPEFAFKLSNAIPSSNLGINQALQIQDFSIHSNLFELIISSKMKVSIIRDIKNGQVIEVANGVSKVQLTCQLLLKKSEGTFYVVQETSLERQEGAFILCLKNKAMHRSSKEVSNSSSQSPDIEAYFKMNKEFLIDSPKSERVEQANLGNSEICQMFRTQTESSVYKNSGAVEYEIVLGTPTLFAIMSPKEEQQQDQIQILNNSLTQSDLENAINKKETDGARRIKQFVIEKIVEIVLNMQIKQCDQDINPKFELKIE